MENATKLRKYSEVISCIIGLLSIIWAVVLFANSKVVESNYDSILEEFDTSSHVSGTIIFYGFLVLVVGLSIAVITNILLKGFADLLENSFSKEEREEYYSKLNPIDRPVEYKNSSNKQNIKETTPQE